MVTIIYEIDKDTTVWYVGEDKDGIRFNGQFIFDGVLVADRVKLKLPLKDENGKDYTNSDTKEVAPFGQGIGYPMKPNSDFDKEKPEDPDTNPAMIFNEEAVKPTIVSRFEAKKKEYENKLSKKADESLALEADSNFKESLTAKENL